jgi:hypothetical protein
MLELSTLINARVLESLVLESANESKDLIRKA